MGVAQDGHIEEVGYPCQWLRRLPPRTLPLVRLHRCTAIAVSAAGKKARAVAKQDDIADQDTLDEHKRDAERIDEAVSEHLHSLEIASGLSWTRMRRNWRSESRRSRLHS